MPTEHRDHLSPLPALSPEIALWTAVMAAAIKDLIHPTRSGPARAWFKPNISWPGSFIWTCHALSLDPTAVRERLAPHLAAQAEEAI